MQYLTGAGCEVLHGKSQDKGGPKTQALTRRTQTRMLLIRLVVAMMELVTTAVAAPLLPGRPAGADATVGPSSGPPPHHRYSYSPATKKKSNPPQPPPPGPAPPWTPVQLPDIHGSDFPGYEAIFLNGECDMNDIGFPNPKGINFQKTCFSCFRIPVIARNPKTGTLLAFAEARRRELQSARDPKQFTGMGGCPDAPDVHVAFKRSTNGGRSWSPLKMLAFSRAAKTPYRSGAGIVVDNVTGTIFLGVNGQDYPWGVGPGLMNSTTDGVSWSALTAFPAVGGGILKGGCPFGGGLVVYNDSLPTKTRLVMHSEAGALYSDNHGTT